MTRTAAERRPAAAPRGAGGRLVVALTPLLLGACAYFNGVYNAKESSRFGDKLSRRGRSDQAQGAYALAAEKAETVLARYPKSRWRPEALYIAGRSAAMVGRCAPAETRLREFLALARQKGSRRERASLALGGCLVRVDRITEGREVLDPLLRSRSKDVAADAALWMARAAIATGATDEAERYLSGLPAGAAQWELASASLERRQYARAESLIVVRARRGDYRDEVGSALRTLWSAGRYDGVERVVDAYAAARTPADAKISLQLLAAEMLEGADRDSAARARLVRAQSLAVDTLRTREVAARLCRLDVADAPTPADADAVLARCSSRARGAPLYQRLQDNLLLVKLLANPNDFTGTSLFLAAEVARDSLRARRMAHGLFTSIPANYPAALLSPKALLAAAAVLPDSAELYQERVRTRYARSPYAVLLAGGDPAEMPNFRQVEDALRKGWVDGIALLADTIAKLRPPPPTAVTEGGAAAAGGRAAAGAPDTVPPPITPPPDGP